MPDKLVTVASYPTIHEAQLALGLLENEGITGFLAGAHGAAMLPAYGIQEVALQVWAEDALRAVGLLAAVAAQAELDDDWESQAEDGANVWICSLCGEPVSQRLEVCYSCQTPRDAIQQHNPARPTSLRQPPYSQPTSESIQARDQVAPDQTAPVVRRPWETDSADGTRELSPSAPRKGYWTVFLTGLGLLFLLLLGWLYLHVF
jgi:hypothetical protein